MSTEVQIPVQSAPVTILDVFTKQVEMNAQLLVIHEQLKAIPDHEQRLRLLEAARAKLIGAATFAGLFAGSLGTWIILVITHH
jgi:hypothetical protein